MTDTLTASETSQMSTPTKPAKASSSWRNAIKSMSVADRIRYGIAAILAVIGLSLIAQGLGIKAKALIGQVMLESAFAQSIASGEPQKPWHWADTHPVAQISFPRLQSEQIVLAGASGEALAWGPAHVHGTARIGESGTSVLAAHRDTHFAGLGALEAGDEIHITRDDGANFTYIVEGTRIAPWDRSGIALASQRAVGQRAAGQGTAGEEPRIALVTCWPLDAKTPGDLRYIVEGSLAPTEQMTSRSAPNQSTQVASGSQGI